MTTMCNNFFGIPQGLMRHGIVKTLSPIALKVIVALWHESERNSTRELKRTVAELQALVGGSRTSHAKARRELIRAGLVTAEPCGPEGFMFRLCDPETRKPWPLPPRTKIPYVRTSKTFSATAPVPIPPVDFRESRSQVEAEADFNFGFNNSQPSATIASQQPRNPFPTWDEFPK